MQNSNHALDRLRDLCGLDRLEWSADGHAELVFNGTTSVTLLKLDDGAFEFITYLDLASFDNEAAALRGLLRANHCGDATGAARLALDPADDQPMLCRRIDVGLYDDRSLEAALLDFIKYATFWQSEEGAAMVPGTTFARERQPSGDDMPFILRA